MVMRSSFQKGLTISVLFLMAVMMGALPSLTYANGPFIVGSPSRGTGSANTASTDIYRFHCDRSFSLVKLWFYGNFNANNTDAYFEAGTATGTVPNGGSSGLQYRETAYFEPQSCETDGYINIKFYRTGTGVSLFRANSLANGWFAGYSRTAIIPNTPVCYSCSNFAGGDIMAIAGAFTFATTSTSTDMSTTTIALAYGPIHFALGVMVFLLAVITWVLLTRRNKK